MNKKVNKQLRHKNIYFLVERPLSQGNEKQRFTSLRELIGIITASAGIFVALLYLAGRFYAVGYFAAMNIPDYQVSFSLWEYSEAAWLPLILYPIGMIAFTGLIWGVIFTIRDWISPLLIQFRDSLLQKVKPLLPAIHPPPLSRETRRWFFLAGIAVYALLLVSLAILTLAHIQDWGEKTGQSNVLENAAKVELVSSVPMAVDDNNLAATQASGQNYYIYKGFRLLTFNNNKYYLFKELNPATCKPLKVYVINTEQGLQVNLLGVESLSSQCQKRINPQAIATSIAPPSTP